MQKSKLWAVLAVVMALTLVLAGCSGASTTPSATTADGATGEKPFPKEITIFNANALTATTPAWDTVVGKKIQELTGVNLVIEYLVGQDIQTKVNLMVAGGIYPDVVAPTEAAGSFIAAEALIPLDDLIEQYGENIKKIYRPSELKLSALQNGKIFIIPTNRPSTDNLFPAAGYYLAYDVLKEAGFPVVKTITEYGQLIKDYVAKNPTYEGQPTIGFTLPTEGGRASALEYGGARFLSGFPNDGITTVDQETLEAKIVMTNPATKEFLRFLNDMWNSGCLDKEIFMQKNDQYIAKISSGRVVGLYDQRWGLLDGLNALDKTGKSDRNLVAFPVTVDDAKTEAYRGSYAITIQGVGITTACKDPEGVFRFLDIFCSDEIQRLVQWGVEGEDYSLVDGKFTRTEEQWKNYIDKDYQNARGIGTTFDFMPRREKTTDEVYGKYEDGNWHNTELNPEFAELRYIEADRQVLKDYNIDFLVDFFTPAYPAKYQPGWAIRQSLAQDSPEFIASTKALEVANEWHAKIAQAPAADFEKLWTEYQNILNAIPGLADYEAKATELTRESAQYYE